MHLHEGPGDILVFLTGSEECELARKMCYIKLEKLYSKGKSVPSMMIFSLYGAQSSEDQAQVFMGVDRNTRKVKKCLIILINFLIIYLSFKYFNN